MTKIQLVHAISFFPILASILIPPVHSVDAADRNPSSATVVEPRVFVPAGSMESEQKFREYVVRAYRDTASFKESFEIIRSGKAESTMAPSTAVDMTWCSTKSPDSGS
jgi:hypothetical protein